MKKQVFKNVTLRRRGGQVFAEADADLNDTKRKVDFTIDLTKADKPFHLRIPQDLRRKLDKERAALPGNVSLNTYLLTLIETHQDRKADIDRNRKHRK